MSSHSLGQAVAPLLQLVEPALQQAADDFQGPDSLVDAMRHALKGGGKRIRPCMVLASTIAAGGDASQALPEAVALELVHTYSLVHDDLPAMDNDLIRRGLPTVHARYGHAMGILAGDALLTIAFQILADGILQGGATDPRRVRSIQALAVAAGANGMVGGQVLDIAMREPTREALRHMHEGKTGALFVAATRMGAIAAGASADIEDRLVQFGDAIGRAFQVGDDIEDLLELGKSGGEHEDHVNWAARFGVQEAVAIVIAETERACLAIAPLPGDTAALRIMAEWTAQRARDAASALRDGTTA
jgi:geranylgeranyl diphosphate synthase type II